MAQIPHVSVDYVGDGVRTVFNFDVPYLQKQTAKQVYVYVDGAPTEYNWLAGSTHTLEIVPAPANGAKIHITRDTPAYDTLHVFDAGVPFLPRYVDENNRQLLYVVQEAIDSTAGTAEEALQVAAEAKVIAERAEDKIDGAVIDSSYQLRLDLAAPTGSTLLGHAVRDLSKKLYTEQVSIQDFGGIDDYNGTSGTDSLPALLAIYEKYPHGVDVLWPRSPTGTGRYLLGAPSYKGDLEGYTFHPGLGVSIHQIGLPSPVVAPGLRVSREFPVRLAAENYTFYLGSQAYAGFKDRLSLTSAQSAEYNHATAINQNNALQQRLAWPSGPVTTAVPAGTASDATEWAVPTDAFVWTGLTIRPGSELSAYVGAAAYSGLLAAGVVTDAGFSLVRQDATGGALQTAVQSGSAPVVESGAINTAVTAVANYRLAYGVVSVRVHSARSYSVLSNGVELIRVADAGGNILSAGIGGGFSTGGFSQLAIGGMSLTRGAVMTGVAPINLIAAGDSITDPAVQTSWVDLTTQLLAGHGGVQVVAVRNIAVSGENSHQQRARFLAENLAGRTHALIQIGTNDIQQGIGATTLTANIGLMLDHCEAHGVVPIVGVPPIFYSAAEAAPYGNTGQATVNTLAGAPARATVMRFLAQRGVQQARTLEGMGAILPSLLATGDPVMMDNIHPTAFGRALLAQSYVRAMLATIFPKVDKTVPATPMATTWLTAPQGATLRPTYAVNADTVVFGGAISVVTDPLPAGQVLLTMPAPLRPSVDHHFVVPTAGVSGVPNGTVSIIISSLGVVTVYGAVAGVRYIYLGAVRYDIPV